MRKTPFWKCALVFRAIAFLITATQTHGLAAEKHFWQPVEKVPPEKMPGEDWIQPGKFRVFNLNHGAVKEALRHAPPESTERPLARNANEIIALPMPDGSLSNFQIVESPVMEAELAAQFPEIKTYLGRGLDDRSASVRLDFTPAGFHAQILSPHGAVYIEPLARGETNLYSSFYKHDYTRDAEEFRCLTDATADLAPRAAARGETLARTGDSLRTYRIAIAAQGEYTSFHGGTVSQAMAEIVTALNRVDGIYEAELAIRLVLVNNNNKIIFTNPNTDPYSANAADNTRMLENQQTIDSKIGANNYDVGIVLNTAGGGIAQVHTVCQDDWKARACVGSASPIGDAFYVDYLAHEIGHQFGALHTFNSVSGRCSPYTRTEQSAYEPGSGSTIMSYAGICGGDNLQQHSDPYFHATSLEEIGEYITYGNGNSCPTHSATGNNPPNVNAGSSYTIPAQTPFRLVASGGDPDGDPVTYCWEEHDLGPAQSLGDGDNGTSPLFRSFNPTNEPSRTFPQMSDVLRGSISRGEKLPTTERTLNFRVTARDGRGGTSSSDTQVFVSGAAGPFRITQPAARVSWYGLTTQTITWDVAGTAESPINAGAVNILFAADGTNFSTMLASWIGNSGSAEVKLPNVATENARIAIAPVGNIFFAVSPAQINLRESVPPQITLQPESQRVKPRAFVTFRVAAEATPPISYQWQFNDNDIPDATAATLTVEVNSIDERGFYRCIVSNPAGSVASEQAELSVVAELIPPTVTIAEPRANARTSNDTVVVQGTASDNALVRKIRFQFNDETPQLLLASNIWSVELHPNPGTNSFTVVSVDSSGNESKPATVSFFHVVTSVLNLWTNGVGTITPNLDGQHLELGRLYSVKASAGRGQVFTGWSGGVNDTNVNLHFVMQPDLQLQANFIPNPFAAAKGLYRGLAFQPGNIQHESSGAFTVTTTDRAAFSSRFQIGGLAYAFNGKLDLNGDATASLNRRGKSPVTLQLHVDLANGSDQVNGNLSDGIWNSEFCGDRNLFNARTNPAPQNGRFTMIFPGNDDANASPGGDGYATILVNKTGAISVAGKLADGTAISQSSALSKNGDWPFYVELYGRKGAVLSWINLNPGDARLFEAGCVWMKPANPRDKYYPAGFFQSLTLFGSRYVAPRGSSVLNFVNGAATFSGGDLAEPFVVDLILSNNVFRVAQTTNKLSLSLNAAVGQFSGSFIHPVTRAKAALNGVILQQQNQARGFFLGSHQSGRVSVNGRE